MAYYIFDTEASAENYNDLCVIAHKHIDTTSRFADVQKHPTLNKWAIQKGKVTSDTGQLVNSLDATWHPPNELI